MNNANCPNAPIRRIAFLANERIVAFGYTSPMGKRCTVCNYSVCLATASYHIFPKIASDFWTFARRNGNLCAKNASPRGRSRLGTRFSSVFHRGIPIIYAFSSVFHRGIHIIHVFLVQALPHPLERFAETLEMHHLARPQEANHVVHIRVIRQPQDVVIRHPRLLLCCIGKSATFSSKTNPKGFILYFIFPLAKYIIKNSNVSLLEHPLFWGFSCLQKCSR